ncbi:MAG TPA: acyl-CoA dehydrogenase family protein, partial [Stenomitos sp.]
MAIDALHGSTRHSASGPNYYHADPSFQALMQEALGPEVLAWARPLLEDMGRMAAQDIVPLAEDANQNVPVLVQYDADGNRLDEVKVHPSYREMTRLAYGAGLGGMFYETDLRHQHGYVPHALVFALGYLFAQAEQGLYCPICMTEGSARLVDLFGDEALKAKFLPGITSRDLSTLLEGAMFLTEKQGGSDVGANETVARQVDGQWRLSGDKWFCSNAGEAGVMMVLARPEGAPAGTKGLGLFLMPKTLEDGSRNHYRINRLKDKLGTRSMASGEFTLEGAIAYPVGDLSRGFRYMTEMLNLSRTYNAVAALAIMRRSYSESLAHATHRAAFGKTIDHYPMVRLMLTSMVVEIEAATAFVWEAIRYLDMLDQGTASDEEQVMRRLLTPMIKYHTGKQAIRFASEA